MKIKELIEKLQEKISESDKFIFKILKLIVFTFENYIKSRSGLWTLTLTYYTLFTIVPVLAIVFVITKGFGAEKILKDELYKSFFIQGEVLDQLIIFAQQALQNAKGGVIAGTGTLFLLWSVIRIFTVIEKSFNEIWKVEESRRPVRKLTDYMSLVVLFPAVIILSNGVTTVLQLFILKIDQRLLMILNFAPHIITTIFFTLMYLIIPNTKVKFKTAAISGIFSGVVFHITQWGFTMAQVNILSYNAVYGSFSLIPIFILWQKILWFIVLLGAHLSFIIQNSYKYSYTINEVNLSFASKLELSLLCIYCHIKNYENNEPSMSTKDVACYLGVSIGVTQDILNNLAKTGFLVEVVTSSDSRKYKIAKNINELSLGYVIKELSSVGYVQKVGGEAKEISEKLTRLIGEYKYESLLKDIDTLKIPIKN